MSAHKRARRESAGHPKGQSVSSKLPLEPTPNSAADFTGAVEYWNAQPASVDGMLGGFGSLTSKDALSSRMFLLTVLQRLSMVNLSKSNEEKGKSTARTRALDVGCGIGRVTSSVLLPLVDSVDLVEPVAHFIQEGKRAAEAKEWKPLQKQHEKGKRLRFFRQGLQEFNPEKPDESACIGRIGDFEDAESREEAGYDVVWCQWCLGHLSDDQLVEWFRSCKRSLRSSDSVIIVKENVTSPHNLREYDENDKSWTRSVKLWKELFAKAGLTLVREEQQKGFPQELFAVWMYALR